MLASHTVQSYRGTVEHVNEELKNNKVLSNVTMVTAGHYEAVFDAVAALHNLRVMTRADSNYKLPRHNSTVLGDYIIEPLDDLTDKILGLPQNLPDLSSHALKHVHDYLEFLSFQLASVKEAVNVGVRGVRFLPHVASRGRDLYMGAYVLQLMVQKRGVDGWVVRYLVGASYSYEIHVGYVEMISGNAVSQSICDCFAG